MADRLSEMFSLLSEYRHAQLRDKPALLLGEACKSNNIADVILVLSRYPEAVRWRDSNNGKTALHLAIAHRNIEIANILIQQGADLNAVDHSGVSSLMMARLKGWTLNGEKQEEPDTARAQRARRAYEQATRADDAAHQHRRRDTSTRAQRTYEAPKAPGSYDASGLAAFDADAQGYVLSSSGDAIAFNDHKEASRWILTVANRANTAQVFEIANHPTLDRKFSAKARKMSPQSTARPSGPKGP